MEKVRKSDWKTQDMPIQNEHFILEKTFTKEDIEKLQAGYLPYEMEDKWFVYYENEKLYIHRSWTGFCIYIMTLLPHQNQHEVIVNRDPSQYSETDIQRDQLNLTILLNALTGHRAENQKLMIQYIKMKK